MDTLSKMKERFSELSERKRSMRADARRALLDEWKAIQEEIDELVPQMRRRAWQMQEAKRESLTADQTRLIRRRRFVREKLRDSEEALEQARRDSDPGAAPLAATVEELRLEEAKLEEKLSKLAGELRQLSVDETFNGTREELLEKLEDPRFFVDRQLVRTLLRTKWKDETGKIYLRFSLADGSVIESSTSVWR